MNQPFLLSFVPGIILVILLSSPQLTSGLTCFECKGRNAPLCEGSIAPHKGKEGVECPGPHMYKPKGTGKSDFSCAIMKSRNYVTGRIEVMKGCVLTKGLFSVEEGISLKRGDCYTHNEEEVPRDVIFEELTVCICGTDNCNRNTINGIGEEDIEYKQALKRKNTASLLNLSSVLILIVILMNIFF